MVRSQKTWASLIVAPTTLARNWRAVYSTSGNSGIVSPSSGGCLRLLMRIICYYILSCQSGTIGLAAKVEWLSLESFHFCCHCRTSVNLSISANFRRWQAAYRRRQGENKLYLPMHRLTKPVHSKGILSG